VAVLVSKLLSKAGFRHGFSTRAGGVSPAPFEAFDFALLRDPDALRENQRRLAEEVGFDPARLHQTMQVHGASVVVANGDPVSLVKREADALVAEPQSGDAVAVRVADCVPVLVADPASGRVAAIHAGWRGVVGGVIDAAVRMMVEGRGAGATSGFVAAIGPCIGACCFEVGADVAEQIAKASDPSVVARRDEARGKAFVDLRRAVRSQLRGLGLSDASIDDVPSAEIHVGCTRCDAARFYSYRRDGDRSGRLVGVIVAR
jgi:hypothetical protein